MIQDGSVAPSSETASPQPAPKTVLQRIDTKDDSSLGTQIGRIVSSRWYAREDSSVLDLAKDLSDETINAVGVVDAQMRVVGIVTRRYLFGLLSRPYGREVMSYKPVSSVMVPARTLRAEESVFVVADSISGGIESEEPLYFALIGLDETFSGIFSTKDMLVYLSSITRHDIELAQRIQRHIVKEYQSTNQAGIRFVANSTMAKGVGGDMYVFHQIAESRYLVAVCDVSGKGVSASLITTFVFGMISRFSQAEDLQTFVADLNSLFVKVFRQDRFVTGVFYDINVHTGEMVICDMAHPFAYLARNGSFSRLSQENGNMPIGVMDHIIPMVQRIVLRPQDMLLVVTDGVSEQTNARSEFFPLLKVAENLLSPRGAEFEHSFIKLIESFHHFRGSVPLHDDVTFLLVQL